MIISKEKARSIATVTTDTYGRATIALLGYKSNTVQVNNRPVGRLLFDLEKAFNDLLGQVEFGIGAVVGE